MHEFNVEMTCEGCATAVTNVLNKKEGMVSSSLYIYIFYLNLKVFYFLIFFVTKHIIINLNCMTKNVKYQKHMEMLLH